VKQLVEAYQYGKIFFDRPTNHYINIIGDTMENSVREQKRWPKKIWKKKEVHKSIILGWCQDNGNRSNQESKFDFLATRQRLVKIYKA